MRSEYRVRPEYGFQVNVECVDTIVGTIRAGSPTAVETSLAEPSVSRRSRIRDLEDQGAQRRDRNEQSGDINEQLLDKWLYPSTIYPNHSGDFYFINYNGKHYKLNLFQREQWVINIVNARNEVTLHNSSKPLYQFLTAEQEETTASTKTSFAKNKRLIKKKLERKREKRRDRITELKIQKMKQQADNDDLSSLQPIQQQHHSQYPPQYSPQYSSQYPPGYPPQYSPGYPPQYSPQYPSGSWL